LDYLIDCRKNWRLAKDLWAEEKDPRRRRILETLIAHAEVPDPAARYLYQQRLLIVWGFDEEGRVLCEDSYSGGGAGFEGIDRRPIDADQIYRFEAGA